MKLRIKLLGVVSVVLAASMLQGCMTPYGKMGLTGGYDEMALSEDTYRVVFRGNGFTSSDRVEGFVLRRSAELTLSKGYKYFVIIGGGTDVSSQLVQTPTTVQTQTSGSFEGSGYGNTSYYGNNASSNYNFSGYGHANTYTTIHPGNQYKVDRYKSGITIKMLHSNRGFSQAYDAAVIMSNFQR